MKVLPASRLPLNTLKSFEATARLGAIGLAASELCVTQGAISQQVKKLEQLLETKLLERQGRGIKLTATGERLFVQLAPLFKQLAAIRLDGDSDSLEGRLKIGCSRDSAALWLVPALPSFCRRYPLIELELVEVEAGDAPSPDVELAILNQIPERADQHVSLLGEQSFFPVCSPQLLAQYGLSGLSDGTEPQQRLAELPLLHDRSAGLWSAWFREAALSYPVEGRARTLPGAMAVLVGARQGLGVALAQRLEVKEALEDGSLVRLGDAVVRGAQAYLLAYSEPELTARGRCFLDWLYDLAKS